MACATAGSTWLAEPMADSDDVWGERPAPSQVAAQPSAPAQRQRLGVEARVIEDEPPGPSSPGVPPAQDGRAGGRVLGTFRNTYYDFPSESDFKGDAIALKNPSCKTIKDVPTGFYEAVCVQGSGILSSGCLPAHTATHLLRRARREELPLGAWGHGARDHTATHGGGRHRRDSAGDTDLHP
jgi:hypothetical protein